MDRRSTWGGSTGGLLAAAILVAAMTVALVPGSAGAATAASPGPAGSCSAGVAQPAPGGTATQPAPGGTATQPAPGGTATQNALAAAPTGPAPKQPKPAPRPKPAPKQPKPAPVPSQVPLPAPAPFSSQTVSVQIQGSITYSNTGLLTSGGFGVDSPGGTLCSVVGSGDLAGEDGGSAVVGIDVVNFFGVYVGRVQISDPGAALDVYAGVITTDVQQDGTTVTGSAVGSAMVPFALTWSITTPMLAPPPPLSITTTSLPGGQAGQPYSAGLAATNGVPPYTWSATGLPEGLSIDPSSGTISGTPTTPGAFDVSVTVTDSESPPATAAGDFSLTVAPAPLSITTTSLPEADLLGSYSASLAATGGVQPYTWSATGLPEGLSIDASTGTISGTPTIPGTFSVTVSVTDSMGTVASSTFGMSVVAQRQA